MKKLLKVRVDYSPSDDEYRLLSSLDGGETWGLSVASRCRRSEFDRPDAEPLFVSALFLERILQAVHLGYELVP